MSISTIHCGVCARSHLHHHLSITCMYPLRSLCPRARAEVCTRPLAVQDFTLEAQRVSPQAGRMSQAAPHATRPPHMTAFVDIYDRRQIEISMLGPQPQAAALAISLMGAVCSSTEDFYPDQSSSLSLSVSISTILRIDFLHVASWMPLKKDFPDSMVWLSSHLRT